MWSKEEEEEPTCGLAFLLPIRLALYCATVERAGKDGKKITPRGFAQEADEAFERWPAG